MKPTNQIYARPPRTWLLLCLLLSALISFGVAAVVAPRVSPAGAAPPLGTGGPPATCADATMTCNADYSFQLNLGNANTWTATQTVPNLIDSGLGTTAGATVCITAGSQLTTSGCSGGGGASLAGNNVWTNFNAYTYVPTTACATSGPTAPVCIGSPTSAMALAIGKVSGGWGGTTSSASGGICFVTNNGTADSACTTSGIAVYGASNGDLILNSTHNINTGASKLIATSVDANGSMVQDFRHIAPLVACSGTGTFTNANANDAACVITLSSGSAVMTFKQAYTVTPVCTATDTTAANAVKAVPTTTTLTLTGTSADVIDVICLGNGGT